MTKEHFLLNNIEGVGLLGVKKRTKYLIIFNPHAGRVPRYGIIHRLVKELGHVEVVKPSQRGDSTLFAQKADADVVIAAGGDGTVNEVVNGLLRNPRQGIVLGVIPLGTSNLYARSLRMATLTAQSAIEAILQGKTRHVDVGKINNRFFINACGAGLDAEMFKNVQPNIKKFFGEVAYPLSLLKTFFSYTPHQLRIEVYCKGSVRIEEGYYALVCNIGKYTRLFQMIPDAHDDDGLLDILIFKNKDLLSQFMYLYSVLAKNHTSRSDIVHLQGERIRISARQNVLAHADAELVGTTPLEITVVPRALRVIVR